MIEAYPDRIISSKEIEDLRQLLLFQKLDYPDYEKWVEKTITEITSGEKKAFGIFSDKLGGDAVIRTTASKTVELKNFFLLDEFRGNKPLSNGVKLLGYVEDYCREYGYSQIHVDAYIDDLRTIGFFVRNGFEFQARGDFYGKNKESYLLIKKLQPRYIGVYDWIDISIWVMKRLLGYTPIKKIKENYHFYKKTEKGLEIASTVLIIDDLRKKVDERRLKKFIGYPERIGMPYCIAPMFSEDAKKYAKEIGIVLIDHDKLEELSGINLPISYSETAGFIVVIKPQYYNDLLKRGDRVYIRDGQIPRNIEKGHILLFYVTAPISGIKGYTSIENISCDTPKKIWSKYNRQSAFSEDEFKTYSVGKQCVTAFTFDKIKQLTKDIDVEVVRSIVGGFNHQTGQKINIEKWEKLKDLM
jgi:predicted transcriptional regulator/GNAT superfamily N-acetyltransferase